MLKKSREREFKDVLELFYYDMEEIKRNNKDHKKRLTQRKFVINPASESYNKLLNIYKTL